MLKQILLLSLFSLCLAGACSEAEITCNGTDSQLAGLSPDSEAYQNRVLEILAASRPEDYRYYFKTFTEDGSDVYMVVNFRKQEQCFDAKILVARWDKLQGMKQTNGLSYPAELRSLVWHIDDAHRVVYDDMADIID